MTNAERIRQSIEGKWRRKQVKACFISWGAVLAGLLVICLFSALCTGGGIAIAMEIFLILAIAFSAVLVPFVLYYVSRLRGLFRNCEAYELYDAVLNHLGTSWVYRGAVYYTVSFATNDGEQVRMDTMPLWTGSVFADNPLEKYNNKRIDLLYDRAGERIIVLGLHK